MNTNKFLLAAAIALALPAYQALAQEKSDKKDTPEYVFTTVKENPISSIKNQYRSGTCWSYSGIGFVESEIMRIKGYKDVDLSEMFIVRNSYHDRAVKYVRLDGDLRFGPGSSCQDVLAVIKEEGIVPESVYSGMNYGTELPEQSEMDAVLAAYVKAVASNPNRTLSTAWLRGFDGILDAYLGEIPESFSYEGKTYTPQSFVESLGLNLDDYVTITSYTHHPMWSQFAVEVQDNWRWPLSYNVPIEDLTRIIDNALENGYTVAWGGDVTEDGFTRDGLGIAYDMDKVRSMSGTDADRWFQLSKTEKKTMADSLGVNIPEIVPTQEMRQTAFDNWETTDDHGMHIYGVAKDQNGREYYMVKNSWGEFGDYKGTWYMTKNFVAYKTMDYMVNKNAIPKDIRKKLGI